MIKLGLFNNRFTDLLIINLAGSQVHTWDINNIFIKIEKWCNRRMVQGVSERITYHRACRAVIVLPKNTFRLLPVIIINTIISYL